MESKHFTAEFKAIIFDVDGVLVQSTNKEGQFLWCENLENDFGIPVEQLKYLFNKTWDDLVVGIGDTRDHIKEFLKIIGSDRSVDEFISYWHKNDSKLNLEMIDLCKDLKKKKFELYLGTVQEKYRANYLWNELNFKSIFTKSFASCFVGSKKPNKEYYKAIEKQLSLRPDEILFLDDHIENILAANELGWKAYHYISIQKSKKDIFDELLKTPSI